MAEDPRFLLKTDDSIMAEDIKRFIEESNIYTLIQNDKPASSVMGGYVDFNPMEVSTIIVQVLGYSKAKEIIQNSPFAEVVQLF